MTTATTPTNSPQLHACGDLRRRRASSGTDSRDAFRSRGGAATAGQDPQIPRSWVLAGPTPVRSPNPQHGPADPSDAPTTRHLTGQGPTRTPRPWPVTHPGGAR